MIFRRRKNVPKGDPEGVMRARRIREEAEEALRRDREEVIKPLQRELYKNNIQEMVEDLLGGRTSGKRNNDPSTSTGGC